MGHSNAIMIYTYSFTIICWLVAFVFFSAALGKLEKQEQFKSNLVESFGLSEKASHNIAPVLVILELVLGLLIISGPSLSYIAMSVAFVIFCFFTLFLIYHWLQNARVKCSCFGEDDRPVSIFDLLRNGLVIALIGTYLVFFEGQYSLPMSSHLLLAGIGLALSILIIHLHDIAMIFLTARGKV